MLQQHAISYRQVAYSAGSYLYQAGERLQKLYYLTTGCVCLLGERQDSCLRYVRQPRMLSMPDLLRQHHTTSALVLENATLVEIDQQQLLACVACDGLLLQSCLQQVCLGMEEEAEAFE